LNDLRSFLRYLVPGITFMLELALLWTLTGNSLDWKALGASQSSIATAVGGLLASGGVGYLLGQAHHVLFWLFPFYAAYDSTPLLSRLQKQKRIEFCCQGCGDFLNGHVPSRRESWQIVTAIWHSRIKTSRSLEGSTARADSLTDLMHGSGSAFVGCCLAAMLTLWFSYSPEAGASYPAVLAAATLLAMHFYSYRTIGSHAEGFVDLVLFNYLSSKPKAMVYFVQCNACKVA